MRGKNNKIIIVLGMHRSGTSAITRSLPVLGVNLGDALHPPAVDNPKGFWENKECLQINEELLNHYNSAYDSLHTVKEISFDDPFVNNLKDRAISLINHQLEEHNGLWAFKDPRTCRLLIFWQEVLRVVGCDVCYVIVSRNPLSVAASLAKRNQIPAEKSYYLWLQHLLPTVLDTVGERRVVVDYDIFMDFPFAQLTRISSAFGLQVPDREGPFFNDYQNNFLEKNLRHTKFAANDLIEERSVPPDVVTAFQLLCCLARDEVKSDDPQIINTFNELFTRLQANSYIFVYISQLEKSNVALQSQLQESENLIVAQQSKLQELLAGNEWLTSQRDEWQKLVAERDDQLTSLNKKIATLESSQEQVQKLIAERDLQLTSLNQEIATLESSQEQVKKLIAERDLQLASLNEAVAALESSQEQEIKEHNNDLERLDVAENYIAELLASTSWRFTKPLRVFLDWFYSFKKY